MRITRSVLLALVMNLLGIGAGVAADIANYADVKAAGGVRLSADELTRILPNARVVNRTQAGSTRSWHNQPDGTFSASSDGRGTSGGRNSYANAPGKWSVDQAGRWCVSIAWNRNPDDWCKIVFKVGDKYYGVNRLQDSAETSEFEITP